MNGGKWFTDPQPGEAELFKNIKCRFLYALFHAVLIMTAAPLMTTAQPSGPVPEPAPNPNPTGRLITPRLDQSAAQQYEDELACFDQAVAQTGWDPLGVRKSGDFIPERPLSGQISPVYRRLISRRLQG